MPALAGPLLDRLRGDAELANATRAAEARVEAARVHEAALAQRQHRRAAAIAETERQLAVQREAARNAAAQSTVRDVLSARAAFLDRVFARAERCFDELAAGPAFTRRLIPIVAEALAFVPPDDTRVRCAEPAMAAVHAVLRDAGRSDATVTADGAVPPGAWIENAAGTVRVNATLAARLHRLRPALSIEAVRIVEEEPS